MSVISFNEMYKMNQITIHSPGLKWLFYTKKYFEGYFISSKPI